jgi:hypothetical protein
MVKCKICNKEFKSSRGLSIHIKTQHKINMEEYYLKYLNGEKTYCEYCGKDTKFINIEQGFRKYCSMSCTNKSPDHVSNCKKTFIEKYGVENPSQLNEVKEKKKKTTLKNYGVEHALQSEEIRNKFKETCLKRYDAGSPLQSDKIKEKVKNTCLERYDVSRVTKLDQYKNKQKETCLKRFGTEYASQNEKIKNKMSNKSLTRFYYYLKNNNIIKPNFKFEEYIGSENYKKYSWKCCKCETNFTDHIDNGHIPKCPTCYPKIVCMSKPEKEVSDFCKQYYPNLIENSRSIIPPLELDIYIPEKKLAIEFDGLYWHSEINGNKDPNYHLNKTLQCEEKGIQLIHIFEDEWLNKQDIVESIIKSKLGIYDQKIYARKTEFKFVSHEKANQFLFDNHLQGEINGQHFGLYYNDELVSLISISKPRFNKNYNYELLRFCNKKNTQVIGSLSKLVKNFKKLNSGTIISYCDRRYSDSKNYSNIGFEQISITKPSYYYIKYFDRYNRMKFQKYKLVDKLPIFDSNLTEWQNMQLNDYDRIFDCGNFVFQYC